MKSISTRSSKTTMEVFEIFPDGIQCELIHGIVYGWIAPTSTQQKVVFRLISQFYNLIEEVFVDKLLPTPINVYLGNHKKAFHPNLDFVIAKNTAIICEDGIYGRLISSSKSHRPK